MKTYNVTIKATVIKTIQVEAEDEDAATEEAHTIFTVAPEDYADPERYEEEAISVKEADG